MQIKTHNRELLVSPGRLNEYVYSNLLDVNEKKNGLMLCNGNHAVAAARLMKKDIRQCRVPATKYIVKPDVHHIDSKPIDTVVSDWVWVPVSFMWATSYSIYNPLISTGDILEKVRMLTSTDFKVALFEAQLTQKYERVFGSYSSLCELARCATNAAVKKHLQG